MKKRQVEIKLCEKMHSWQVIYLDRKKGGRYKAAGFDSRYTAHEDVVKWVKNKPNLILVENEAV